MPAKSKRDLKAVDDKGRRTFCRDRHLIEWNHADIGLCSAGDQWRMSSLRLVDDGQAGWSGRSGTIQLGRKTWYAPLATGDKIADELVLSFDCSHDHYPHRSRIALGDREAQRQRFETYPREIQQVHDAETMREAINLLTEQGWVFGERILCPVCITEELALTERLARLAERDKAME